MVRVVKNVVDIYHYVDGLDMPMEVITYYNSESGEFETVEVVEGAIEKIEASDEVKKLFEEKVREVEEHDRKLAKKLDSILNGKCVICGGKIYPIRNEAYKRFLRLNSNRSGFYCPGCKTTYIHNRYPSPCHFSESVEAIRGNEVVYRISFNSYYSPLTPRFVEFRKEVE